VRRRENAGEPAPVELCRFAPAEWPGDLSEAFRAWKAARFAWVKEHPGSVLGDFLDVLAGDLVELRRWFINRSEIRR
jgi:hypothetical protein